MPSVIVSKNSCKIEALYQWDVGQVLHIHGLTLPAAEVHFAHGTAGMAIVRTAEVSADGVISVGVPNVLLQEAKKINAYICTYEGEAFQSLYRIEIPVIARAKPSEYANEDEAEVYSLEALGVEVITLAADETATVEKVLQGDKWLLRFSIPKGVDGKTPVKGRDYWTADEKQLIVEEVLADLSNGEGTDSGNGKSSVTIVIGTTMSGHLPEDCNYLCDGMDDQDQINQAVLSLAATNGGEIKMLEGEYRLDGESIEIDENNVTLTGCGNTVLKNGTISVWGDNCTVRDLVFDTVTVSVNAMQNAEVSRCRFANGVEAIVASKSGARIAENRFANVECPVGIQENVSGCVIADNILVDCLYGMVDRGDGNTYQGNIISGNADVAISAFGSNAYITDNVINVSGAEPFVVQGENNVHVNNFVNGVLVDAPSGGASSWNDLTDKPFGVVYGDTLTWDGNIDGLVSVDGAAYKISDATPSVDEVLSGSLTATVDGETGTIPLADYPPEEMGSGVALYFYTFLVVPESAVGVDLQGLVFPEAGLYVVPAMAGAVLNSLTIPGYTGFKTETINASCIPDTIQRTITGTPGDFVVIGEDGKATTGEPPAGGGKLWQKIAEYDVGADIAAGVATWEESGFSFDELRFVYKNMVSSTTSASGLMGYINDAYMQGVQLVRTNGSAQANGGSGWSEVRLVPDGVLTTQGSPANAPTNYALNGLSAALNAIPCDYSDGKIFRYRLTTNPSHPPVSGTFAVYGR